MDDREKARMLLAQMRREMWREVWHVIQIAVLAAMIVGVAWCLLAWWL